MKITIREVSDSLADLINSKITKGDSESIDFEMLSEELKEKLKYGSTVIVETIEDRDSIDEGNLIIGLSVFVVETLTEYVYIAEGVWRASSANAVHIGGEAPNDTTMLWIDDKDENVNASLDSEMFEQIKDSIRGIKEVNDKLKYALDYELDAGYFNGKMPGDEELDQVQNIGFSDDETILDPDYIPDYNGAAGTVNRIRFKRGYKSDIEALHEGEVGFCIDTEELYIGNKGGLRLLAKVGGLTGSSDSNITGEYVELVSQNGEKYRVRVNDDGDLYTYKSIADTADNPLFTDAPLYSGLVINHCYGGGAIDANLSVCSHGFIEIYNSNTTREMNLKGLSIQYSTGGTNWNVLPLNGIVKPLHSFLIRCAQHTDINRKTCRFKIRNYDMQWNIPLSNNGFKVYLGIGTEPLSVVNPANIDNIWTRQQGYIDLFAFGSSNPAITIDAYEKNDEYDGYLRVGNIGNSVHRKDFIDTDSSFMDLEALSLQTVDVETYTPRCTKDGQWIIYYNKLKMYPNKPNMINIGFGKDGDTTRTFNWQTLPTNTGFLKYKRKGDSKWIVVETERETGWFYDTDVTVHKAIVKNLTPGVYVYIAGEEAMWSDEYELVVKTHTNSDSFKFLFTTDQQGVNEEEYVVWEDIAKIIEKEETFDFILNAGDISNDGAEFAFQWRYYYDKAKKMLSTTPHMSCCGNNDLTRNEIDGRKTDPIAFNWFGTYEDQHIISCFSWNYAYMHFICLNSNLLQDPDIIEIQIEWLREDMAKPENKKRWTVVMIHEGPYTIVKNSTTVRKLINVFAELKIDLVLCGHHHRYSRSYRMGAEDANGNDTINDIDGTYYVMAQAAGTKLMGRTVAAAEGSAPWRATWEAVSNPMYIMWDVSYDSLTMRPYTVANILPETKNDFNEPELIRYNDNLVITKP